MLARPSIPNSFITALALRIETPLIYISATAQKTERLERRPCSRDCGKNVAPHSSKVVVSPRYNHAQRVLRSINLFALVTIGITQSQRNRFRMPHTKKLFPLHTYGQTEQSDKHWCHFLRSIGCYLFLQFLNHCILILSYFVTSMSVWQCSWNNKITDRPTGGMPPVANLAQTPNEFRNVRLHGLEIV